MEGMTSSRRGRRRTSSHTAVDTAITSDHIVLHAARADIRVATDVGVENHLIADGNGR